MRKVNCLVMRGKGPGLSQRRRWSLVLIIVTEVSSAIRSKPKLENGGSPNIYLSTHLQQTQQDKCHCFKIETANVHTAQYVINSFLFLCCNFWQGKRENILNIFAVFSKMTAILTNSILND